MSCNRHDCAFKGTNTDTCDYILVTGKRRGCPDGPLCIRYKPVTVEEGYSDQEISADLGVSKDTVARWRRSERLPSRETRRQIMSAHEKAALVLKTESGLVRNELSE